MHIHALLCRGTTVAAMLFAFSAHAEPPQSWNTVLDTEVRPPWNEDRHRQFDFWIGEWQMQWRRQQPGAFYHDSSGTWTRQHVFPALGGKALIEIAWNRDAPETPSQRGMSIRYYNETTKRWVMAQSWPNPNGGSTGFVDQLTGSQYLGRHSLYSVVQLPQADGEPKTEHRRYDFSDIRPEKNFRWQGSNTADEGATWYTWYQVDAHYLRPLDTLADADDSLPGMHNKQLCADTPQRRLDVLAGVWWNEVGNGQGDSPAVRFTAGEILDGCGLLAVLDVDDEKRLMTFGYLSRFDRHVMMLLDSRPGSPHRYFVATASEDNLVFEDAPGLAIADEFAPYLTNQAFDTQSALTRIVVNTSNANQLLIEEQRRPSESDDWIRERGFRLRRDSSPPAD